MEHSLIATITRWTYTSTHSESLKSYLKMFHIIAVIWQHIASFHFGCACVLMCGYLAEKHWFVCVYVFVCSGSLTRRTCLPCCRSVLCLRALSALSLGHGCRAWDVPPAPMSFSVIKARSSSYAGAAQVHTQHKYTCAPTHSILLEE